MADDSTPTTPSFALDKEGERLQLEAAKAEYRQRIASATQGVATTLLPDMSTAPKGEVSLGEKAGALGPWLTHHALDEAARSIADEIRRAVSPAAARVLVVEDRSLILGDWTRWQVEEALSQLTTRARRLKETAQKAKVKLEAPLVPDPVLHRDVVPAQSPSDSDRFAAVAASVAGEGEDAESGEEAAAGGVVSAASVLLGLLRTDYTLEATTATPTSSKLAALTAAYLRIQTSEASEPSVEVELDAFCTLDAGDSILKSFKGVRTTSSEVASLLAELEALVAPLDSELKMLEARIGRVEQAWTEAVQDPDVTPSRAETLRQELETLVSTLAGRRKAYGPPLTSVERIRQGLADVETGMRLLLESTDGRQAPLLTAVTRKRLHSGNNQERVTHVLYVAVDEAHGDVVARRSLLGTSGRLGFIGSLNASWLLLDTATGQLAQGAAVARANRMIYDIDGGVGETKRIEIGSDETLAKDPLRGMEKLAIPLVIIVTISLLLIAVVGTVNLLAG